MDASADDFLAKPFDPPELKARLQVDKRIVELQQKLVSANEALHYAATMTSSRDCGIVPQSLLSCNVKWRAPSAKAARLR
jgi:DNA-binding response OmpR family regulator